MAGVEIFSRDQGSFGPGHIHNRHESKVCFAHRSLERNWEKDRQTMWDKYGEGICTSLYGPTRDSGGHYRA